jgi:hypothetical protein
MVQTVYCQRNGRSNYDQYWGISHLKEEAPDRTMRRAHFGKGFGPVVRQTTK